MCRHGSSSGAPLNSAGPPKTRPVSAQGASASVQTDFRPTCIIPPTLPKGKNGRRSSGCTVSTTLSATCGYTAGTSIRYSRWPGKTMRFWRSTRRDSAAAGTNMRISMSAGPNGRGSAEWYATSRMPSPRSKGSQWSTAPTYPCSASRWAAPSVSTPPLSTTGSTMWSPYADSPLCAATLPTGTCPE